MKKVAIVSVLSFVFLLIASIVECILSTAQFSSAWAPLIIGVVILSASGIVAIFGKEKVFINVLCFIISGVALGFCIRAWYIFRCFNNNLGVLILVSLCCILYLWIVFALSKLNFAGNHPCLFIVIVMVVSLIIYVCLVAFTKTTYVSTLGYYMIIEIAFLFAMFASVDDGFELFRNVTLSTYSVLVVAIIIAIMILSESADFDFSFDFDLSGADFGSNAKKTKKLKEELSKNQSLK